MPLDADALAALAQFSAQARLDEDEERGSKADEASAATRPDSPLDQSATAETAETAGASELPADGQPAAQSQPLHSDQSHQASSFLSLTTGTASESGSAEDMPTMVARLFSEEIGLPLEQITPNLHLKDDLRIDTLALYSIVAQVERTAKITVSDRSLQAAGTVGDLQDLFSSAAENS